MNRGSRKDGATGLCQRVFVFCALAMLAVSPMSLSASDDAQAAAQQKQKRKQKSKKPAAAPAAGAAAATGTAAAAAATTSTAAQPAKPADAGKPTETAAAAEGQNIVKTDLYTVVDGYRVDEKTMNGFRAWRGAACDRCHGANQEGMVGPSLVESLKVLSRDDFKKTITEGRLEKGMPSFNTSEQVMKNIDNLYNYLKGRSDGAIKPGRVEELKE